MKNEYKVFINNEWKFGNILIDVKNNKKVYYIYTQKQKIKIDDKNNICKSTGLNCKNGIIYTKDIISFKTDKGDIIGIIDDYKGNVKITNDYELYIDGLVFKDFNFKPYLLSKSIIDYLNDIEIVGNLISNNINEVENNE